MTYLKYMVVFSVLLICSLMVVGDLMAGCGILGNGRLGARIINRGGLSGGCSTAAQSTVTRTVTRTRLFAPRASYASQAACSTAAPSVAPPVKK